MIDSSQPSSNWSRYNARLASAGPAQPWTGWPCLRLWLAATYNSDGDVADQPSRALARPNCPFAREKHTCGTVPTTPRLRKFKCGHFQQNKKQQQAIAATFRLDLSNLQVAIFVESTKLEQQSNNQRANETNGGHFTKKTFWRPQGLSDPAKIYNSAKNESRNDGLA